MITSLAAAILMGMGAGLLAPVQAPPLQKPSAPAPAPTDVEAEPAPTDVETAPTDVEATPTEAEPTDIEAEPASTDVETEPASTDVEAEPTEAEAEAEAELRVVSERSGPPFYSEADLAELRTLHQVEPSSPPPPPAARWHCLIADPTCRHSFEIQGMGAYALRARQGDVSRGNVNRWSSARAQYDFWLSLPALVETEGKNRYTRMSLGPKGGVVFSDGGDLWGNLGIAARYWLGRGRWAPSIEITSALAFKLGTRVGNDVQAEKFRMQRGPVGFMADVGFGLGGFGAIVIGGQYDSPLAREEVPEEYRVSASGMFFVGFRGNILWGGPAVAAVAAHAGTRGVERP